MTTNKPHLILVEGQTDKDFFLQWVTLKLQKKGNRNVDIKPIAETVDIESKGGDSKVLAKFKALLLSTPYSDLKSLFAIVDADDDYQARCNQFKTIFKEVGVENIEPNTVVPYKNLSVGFFVIGDQKTFQDLDSLLLQIRIHQEAQYQNPLIEFDNFLNNNNVSYPHKSKLSIHLAHLPVFCVHHLGEGLKHQYFNIDAPQLDFLNELFEKIKPPDTVQQATP
jgi:hypothetical protein